MMLFAASQTSPMRLCALIVLALLSGVAAQDPCACKGECRTIFGEYLCYVEGGESCSRATPSIIPWRDGEAWIPCPEATSLDDDVVVVDPQVEAAVDEEDPVEPFQCPEEKEIRFTDAGKPYCRCPSSTGYPGYYYREIGDKCEKDCEIGYERVSITENGEPVCREKCSEGYEKKGGECVKEETCYNFCEVDLGDVRDFVSREVDRVSEAQCRTFIINAMRSRIQNTLNVRETLSTSQISQMAKVSQTTTFAGPVVSNTLTGESGKTESDQVWTKFSDEPWVISIDGDCTIDESTYLCQPCQEDSCTLDLFGACVNRKGCATKGINKAHITCPLKARSMRKCCTSTGSNKFQQTFDMEDAFERERERLRSALG